MVEGTAEAAANEIEPTAAQPSPAPVAAADAVLATDDAYFRVPKDPFKPWGGRWGEAVSRANKFDQAEQSGLIELAQELSTQALTPAQMVKLLRENQDPEPAETPPEQPTGESPEPFTRQQYREEREREREEEVTRKTEADKQAQQQAWQQGRRTATEEFAKSLKLGGDTVGTRQAKATFEHHMTQAIRQVLESDINLTPEAREKFAREFKPEPEELATATAAATAEWQDLGNTFNSDFVAGQGNVPVGTLGAGGGGPGKGSPKPMDEMTEAEKVEYVTSTGNYDDD